MGPLSLRGGVRPFFAASLSQSVAGAETIFAFRLIAEEYSFAQKMPNILLDF